MRSWTRWNRGHGEPRGTTPLVDVKYLDGKEFYRKPIENTYWGADSLIEWWRPSAETPAP